VIKVLRSKPPRRAYSREFTPHPNARQVTLSISRVPPPLMAAVRARAKRDGVSVRALVLGFLRDWSAAS
jgi:hypothetical protein